MPPFGCRYRQLVVLAEDLMSEGGGNAAALAQDSSQTSSPMSSPLHVGASAEDVEPAPLQLTPGTPSSAGGRRPDAPKHRRNASTYHRRTGSGVAALSLDMFDSNKVQAGAEVPVEPLYDILFKAPQVICPWKACWV